MSAQAAYMNNTYLDAFMNDVDMFEEEMIVKSSTLSQLTSSRPIRDNFEGLTLDDEIDVSDLFMSDKMIEDTNILDYAYVTVLRLDCVRKVPMLPMGILENPPAIMYYEPEIEQEKEVDYDLVVIPVIDVSDKAFGIPGAVCGTEKIEIPLRELEDGLSVASDVLDTLRSLNLRAKYDIQGYREEITDDVSKLFSAQTYAHLLDWVQVIEANYWPMKYDPCGLFVLPRAGFFESSALVKPMRYKDLEDPTFRHIFENYDYRNMKINIYSSTPFEHVRALITRFALRSRVNMSLIRRCFSVLYLKFNKSRCTIRVSNFWRKVVTVLWQAIVYYVMGSVETYWWYYAYDLYSQLMIKVLYQYGMLPGMIEGNVYKSMTGTKTVTQYYLDSKSYSDISCSSLQYEKPMTHVVYELIFLHITFDVKRHLKWVNKQFYWLFRTSYVMYSFVQHENFLMYKKFIRTSLKNCEHPGKALCQECLSELKYLYKRYKRYYLLLQEMNCVMAPRDDFRVYPFLDKNYYGGDKWIDDIRAIKEASDIPVCYPMLCFYFASQGYKDSWIHWGAAEFIPLVLKHVLTGSRTMFNMTPARLV